jgi:arylsulfatase A-like enzyme
VLKEPARGDLSRLDAIYWHYPHYHGSTWAPGGAIRAGHWKLIECFENDATELAELYDLASDPGEQRDLSGERPDKRDELLAGLRAWRLRVGAAMPRMNPEWREKGSR